MPHPDNLLHPCQLQISHMLAGEGSVFLWLYIIILLVAVYGTIKDMELGDMSIITSILYVNLYMTDKPFTRLQWIASGMNDPMIVPNLL